MLALNRVTRVMHKLLFKARQRRTVGFFRRYVLTENDIDPDINPDEAVPNEPLSVPLEKLWDGFDPESDFWDRRLLYEVTGARLDETEFRGDDTSDDETNLFD